MIVSVERYRDDRDFCRWNTTAYSRARHGGPVIFWGMYPHQEHEVEHLWEELLEIVSEKDFLLVAFQVEDWNRDFSPWEAPAAFGTERFAGQGRNTLRWLTEECIPYIEKTYDVKDCEYWLMGYSLAGLFALWAGYECDMFSGIVCCSGSMWFKDLGCLCERT